MFSRDRPDLMHDHAMVAMDFPPFCRAISGILTRNPQDLLRYQDALLSVLASFRFINEGPEAKSKLRHYRRGLQTCFQLFQLVADFGKAQELLAVNSACISKINEGQEKWTLNDKKKIDEKRYPEATLEKQLTGYRILYEGLVRYSIIPFTWCIDTVESFDLSSRRVVGDVESYFRRNVSYQIKRIRQPQNPFPFQVDLPVLTEGLDDHWRNAIAHETLQYQADGVLLRDADPRDRNKPAWERFATSDEIDEKLEQLYVTHYVHTTALTLFGIEHEEKIDWSGHKGWETEKELASLIARRVERLKLVMCPPIEFDARQIVLNLKKQDGFDHPSSAFWGGPSGIRRVDIPAYNLERQLFCLAKFCSSIMAPQEHLEVHLFDFEGVEKEAFKVNISAAEKLPVDAPDLSSAVQKLV
jgi:hypothetical protein